MPAQTQPPHLTQNYEAFTAMLPSLLAAHAGKFALMRDRKVVDYFDTAGDAYLSGKQLFPDQRFSVQEVIDTPVDLGFFSHAVS